MQFGSAAMSKLLEPLAYAAICVSLIIGAYHAGKLKERQWWRAEIATKSASVRAAIAKLDADAEDFDATLVRLIGEDDAKLAEAEKSVAAPAPPAVADPGDPCRPVPAHCVRRQGPSDNPARRAAAGQ